MMLKTIQKMYKVFKSNLYLYYLAQMLAQIPDAICRSLASPLQLECLYPDQTIF